MNIPRNGSPLSNCLLVTAGAAVGACATLLLHAPSENASALGKNPAAALAQQSAATTPAGPRSTAATTPQGRARSLEELIAQPTSAEKSQALTELGHQLAMNDPLAAMATAQKISGDADRLDFLRGAMAAWSLTDPEASLAFAKSQLPNGQAQSESIRVAINAWSAKDPRAAYVWMEENLSGPLKEEALGTFAQSWARTAPDKAAAWFVETGSTSQTLLNNLVTGWAAIDPAAAISWSAQLTQPGNQRVGLITAIGELARQNPVAAADAALPFLTDAPPTPSIAGSAPEGTRPSLPDLPTILADIWGTSDPAAAAKWVSELPPGASRTEAASTLATVWAASDIQSAVKWSESFSDPEMRSTIVEHLATTWGAIEPDKAIAWLNTQPPEIAANGIRGAYNSWAATDPVGMRDWLGQLPPGLGTDQARGSLADVLSGTDPLAALDLARNMFSPSAQSDALNRYYRSWQRQNPAEASEWLTAEWATLPPRPASA